MSDLIERLRGPCPSIPAMRDAADEIERLTAELESERMRLVACGVVALANTTDSASRERDMLPEYRSASLDAIERAVDSEMQLRDERDELRRKLAEAEQDARRYRYLRDQQAGEVDDYGTVGIKFRCDFEHYRDLDAAIDAAMGLTRPAEE